MQNQNQNTQDIQNNEMMFGVPSGAGVDFGGGAGVEGAGMASPGMANPGVAGSEMSSAGTVGAVGMADGFGGGNGAVSGVDSAGAVSGVDGAGGTGVVPVGGTAAYQNGGVAGSAGAGVQGGTDVNEVINQAINSGVVYADENAGNVSAGAGDTGVNSVAGANGMNGSGAGGTKDDGGVNQANGAKDEGVVYLAADMAEAAVRRKEFVAQIMGKLNNSENILVALSKNPSVDEMSAAIGLTLYLDSKLRHVTAIYSGKTPEALAFLRPELTFESNTSSLQDFVIALSKEKADHLRYKLDGDFVKVYITPYKTEITEKDLTFSQGDYNVDFVMAVNVRSAGDLDEALMEYGRIMHDATIVDITRGEPGRLGEIEWSDPTASSVCEMMTELILALQGEDGLLDADVATALLTGIVAATERFSNRRTTPQTLELASKLMAMGADQQLISANVMSNVIEKQAAKSGGEGGGEAPKAPALGEQMQQPGEAAQMGIEAAKKETAKPAAQQVNPAAKIARDMAESVGMVETAEGVMPMPPAVQTEAVTPVVQPVAGATRGEAEVSLRSGTEVNPGAYTIPTVGVEQMSVSARPVVAAPVPEEPKDYAQMLEQALAEGAPVASGAVISSAGVPGVGDEAPKAPALGEQMQLPGEAVQLPGELVAKPEAVLPPPPAPPLSGPEAMPPSLPPVQM